MTTVVIACETIKNELNEALGRLGLVYEVYWLEGGLHNSPQGLRDHLQGVLNQIDTHCRRLILTLGHCGGGVCDLKTGNYETVLPLADDCLSLLLGSMARRKEASQPPTYFLTEGWLFHENNVVAAYEQAAQKYGEEKARRINKMMLKNYGRFALLDTGAYDLEEAALKIAPLAQMLGIKVEALWASRLWLDALLTGPYDDPSRFLLLKPHSHLTFDHWQALLT
ncbi:MAG: DUF1638 domain-containing protein [Candidatus Adiutrix sp.]